MAFIRDDIPVDAPEIILRIYMMGYYKIPVPTSLYIEAKEKYPKYFKENKPIKNRNDREH